MKKLVCSCRRKSTRSGFDGFWGLAEVGPRTQWHVRRGFGESSSGACPAGSATGTAAFGVCRGRGGGAHLLQQYHDAPQHSPCPLHAACAAACSESECTSTLAKILIHALHSSGTCAFLPVFAIVPHVSCLEQCACDTGFPAPTSLCSSSTPAAVARP